MGTSSFVGGLSIHGYRYPMLVGCSSLPKVERLVIFTDNGCGQKSRNAFGDYPTLAMRWLLESPLPPRPVVGMFSSMTYR